MPAKPKQPTPAIANAAERFAASFPKGEKPTVAQLASHNLQRMGGRPRAEADRLVGQLPDDVVVVLASCDDGRKFQQIMAGLSKAKAAAKPAKK